MSVDCSVSDVSRSSGLSLEDQLFLFQSSFKLDSAAALLLLKGDIFRDNNQLKQARMNYHTVLQKYPTCIYAADSARAVESLLEEETQRENVASVASRTTSGSAHTITEMSIEWLAYEHPFLPSEGPSHDQVAHKKAQKELHEKGFSRSLLRLLDNRVVRRRTVECFEEEIHGRANFQVTLIPDSKKPTQMQPLAIPRAISPLPHLISSESSVGSSKFADASHSGKYF